MPMRFLQATSCWMMKGTWLSQIKDGIVEWRRCIVCYAVWWGLNSQVDSTLIPAALGVIKKHPGLPTFTCCRESQRRFSTWTLVSCCVAHLAGRWNYWNLQLLFYLFRLACMFWYVLVLKSCESVCVCVRIIANPVFPQHSSRPFGCNQTQWMSHDIKLKEYEAPVLRAGHATHRWLRAFGRFQTNQWAREAQNIRGKRRERGETCKKSKSG